MLRGREESEGDRSFLGQGQTPVMTGTSWESFLPECPGTFSDTKENF